MNVWYDPRSEREYEYEPPTLEVEVTENPVAGQLLGPDGAVLVEVRKRPPIGFVW